MFCKLKSIVKCYLCGDSHKRFKTCQQCKKLFCGDCKSTVFVSGPSKCFWCLSKNYKN